jgi:hypothetical protein
MARAAQGRSVCRCRRRQFEPEHVRCRPRCLGAFPLPGAPQRHWSAWKGSWSSPSRPAIARTASPASIHCESSSGPTRQAQPSRPPRARRRGRRPEGLLAPARSGLSRRPAGHRGVIGAVGIVEHGQQRLAPCRLQQPRDDPLEEPEPPGGIVAVAWFQRPAPSWRSTCSDGHSGGAPSLSRQRPQQTTNPADRALRSPRPAGTSRFRPRRRAGPRRPRPQRSRAGDRRASATRRPVPRSHGMRPMTRRTSYGRVHIQVRCAGKRRGAGPLIGVHSYGE